MIRVYEAVFNQKVNSFSSHPRYHQLREQADTAIRLHTGYGPQAIAAGDFMDRIVKMPLPYILAWLDHKNNLEWINLDTGENYDKENLADALNRQF